MLEKSSYNKVLKGLRKMRKYYDLYLLMLPVLIYFAIFKYGPMYGLIIAFKDFKTNKGIWGSAWVGFKHFARFFGSYNFTETMLNTLSLSALQLICSFPAPIILAVILNELSGSKFKKVLQTVTYAPHFLSVVVMISLLTAFLSPSTGIINTMLKALGTEPIYFMAKPNWFRPLYILSDIWQSTGWNSIIYMATLAGIDITLYEAGSVDGASRLQKLLHITLPSMIPVIVTMLILNCGKVLGVGFEKVFLMQNSLNIGVSEVISTYVYKVGIADSQFSYSAAIGLFNSVINLVMLVSVNKVSKKLTETSLW